MNPVNPMSSRPRRVARTLRLLAAAALAGSISGIVMAVDQAAPAPGSAAAPADAASAGVWQLHKYQFNFLGFTSIYSCEGLQDKLRVLLRLNGAAPDMKVGAPCVQAGRPDRLAFAYLTFSTLKPDSTATGTNGTWKHVQLAPQHPSDLQRGDCELIEQFRDRVLPMFTTRNLKNDVSCIPHQDFGTNYSLTYDVFVPVKDTTTKVASP